ncbi:MAG: 23S rRNA (guanosine(2251)-2'-O)-methyltransferase RlmB [Coriobacteriales bacterium]|jgi:23S rRNA (guanosine2251-2'-O)-methyltransferase|nr:23S rRNA (guanosine(2251)-2'-O)-methyltransferase RlmB [Coriobacteriales bacterium]
MSEWREKSKQAQDRPYNHRYSDIHDLVQKAAGKEQALILVLDHLTDVGNFGALIRSAEVVGADGIIIPNRRAAQVNDAVFRTSAGAVEWIPIVQVPNLVAAMATLKEAGFWIAGVTEHAGQGIWQAPLDGRLALVMGAEDTGISRLVRESCDFEFQIPQFGRTQSLNVAQAATVALYEWRRRQQ